MNERSTSQPRRTAPWGALAAVLGAVLLSAAHARAEGNFQRGFETELGRIAAHQTVAVGAHVLLGAPLPAVHTLRVDYRPAVYAPPHGFRHGVRAERHHARHDRRHERRHERWHERWHHRRDRDCHGH